MMKNKKLHTIILPLCTLLLFSCTQDTISPASDSENEIRFQTGTPTRGLIDNLAVGSEICLYGYKDDNPLANDNENKRLEGKTLKYLNTDRWSVVNNEGNPLTYFWEGEGTYRFFGWLAKDATGLEAPKTNWTSKFENDELEIVATLDANYNQFDFLYSNVHERTLPTQSKSDPVALEMNHLFTAFGIGISNTSEDDITVKSVTLRTIHDKGSATIDFSTTPCTVNPGQTSIATNPFRTYSSNVGYTVSKDGGVVYNIFNPSATKKEYYIVWPQDKNVFPKLTFANDEDEAKEPDTSFPLILEYTADGKDFKKRMQLPQMDWEPGKLNYFEILVADKLVEIKATVKDWKYSHADVDFSTSTVAVKDNNHLIWDENTCTVNHDTRTVYVKNGQPVEGTFTIDAPEGGQWHASLEGRVDKFTIMDDTTPTTDGFGPIDGKQHRIRIVPLDNDPQESYSVKVKFVAITADSKTVSADNLLQDYTGDKHADRYTIVLGN